MSYQGSPFSTMYDRQDDYDLDEDNEEYLEDDRDIEDQDESDEGRHIINYLTVLKMIVAYLHEIVFTSTYFFKFYDF